MCYVINTAIDILIGNKVLSQVFFLVERSCVFFIGHEMQQRVRYTAEDSITARYTSQTHALNE